MFDKPRGRFLNFIHFGAGYYKRLPRFWVRASCCWAALGICGCSPQSAPGTVEDTVTSGRIKVVCAPEAYGLISLERSAFQALYPQASVALQVGTSREAIGALFGAQSDLAVIAREIRPDERRAAVTGGLELEGYRFARNAVVMVVHPSNPVENLALQDLRRIYSGDLGRWSALGGSPTAITPVVQSAGSDITEFFIEEVMGGEPLRARAVSEPSDSAVAARVRSDPNAIGYLSLGTSIDDLKVVRLASVVGLPYWKPDLEAVYKGEYPLTRFFNLYMRADGPKLSSGFITFITSFEGQRIVRDLGLVPTTIPVRFVRRSPLLGAH